MKYSEWLSRVPSKAEDLRKVIGTLVHVAAGSRNESDAEWPGSSALSFLEQTVGRKSLRRFVSSDFAFDQGVEFGVYAAIAALGLGLTSSEALDLIRDHILERTRMNVKACINDVRTDSLPA